MVIGTLVLIAASSMILSYNRIRQNIRPYNDDMPPEPRFTINIEELS
jgi:hypothetical protein